MSVYQTWILDFFTNRFSNVALNNRPSFTLKYKEYFFLQLMIANPYEILFKNRHRQTLNYIYFHPCAIKQ